MNERMRVARPRVTGDVLVNPGMGFMTFQRFNGDALNPGAETWTEGHPIEYHASRGREPVAHYPDTSLAYFRVYWSYLEPQRGVYNWVMLDKALETARSRGQTLLLRIAPHGFDHTEDVPRWYRELVGPRRDFLEPKWQVDPNDPRYAEAFGHAIRALGARYDGHPDLESVDMALMSAWGESENAELLTLEAMEALITAYTDTFRKTPLLLLLNDPLTSAIARRHANVGYRADCLGDMREGMPYTASFKEFSKNEWSHMLDWYPRLILETGMENAWQRAPVSFEICWVLSHWQRMGWDVSYIIDQSLKWHISSFNAKSSLVPEGMEPEVERWLKRMGYRLALRRFTWPETVSRLGTLPYTCWVENQGVAPCYKPFRFALRVYNEMASRVFVTDARLIRWLPGDHLCDGAFQLEGQLPPGEYEIQAGIIGPRDETPRVCFAMEGRRPDGWYALGPITLTEA